MPSTFPGVHVEPGLTTYSRLARGVYLKEARAWLLRLTQGIDPLTVLPLLSAFGFPSRRRLPKQLRTRGIDRRAMLTESGQRVV